jgi:hypothetical protein
MSQECIIKPRATVKAETQENRGNLAIFPDPPVFGDASASRAVGALTHICKLLRFPKMSRGESTHFMARALIWMSGAGASIGWPEPDLARRLGLGDGWRRRRHDHPGDLGFDAISPALAGEVGFARPWLVPAALREFREGIYVSASKAPARTPRRLTRKAGNPNRSSTAA